MTLNPQADSPTEGNWWDDSFAAVEAAEVVNAKAHTGGDGVGHHVEVQPYSMQQSDVASVLTAQLGDTVIPEEGDHVLVAHRLDGRPVVLGAEYGSNDTVPDFQPGERRIGHPASDSHVRFKTDGSVEVVGANGNEITLNADGTITINDGTTAPVTDVSTQTDADGHVTDVTVTRADGILLPSN